MTFCGIISCGNSCIMSAPGVFCLLMAIVALNGVVRVTEALECQECTTADPTCSKPCTTTTGSCLSFAGNNTLDGKDDVFYYKSCYLTQAADRVLSFSFGKDNYFVSNLTFCSVDNCNAENNQVVRNSTPNGRHCPSCFNNTNDACTPVLIPCVGPETYCVNATGKITAKAPIQGKADSSLFAARGCTIPSTINMPTPFKIQTSQNIYEITNKELSEAPLIPATEPPATTTSTTTKGNSGSSKHALKNVFFAILLPALSWALWVKLLS